MLNGPSRTPSRTDIYLRGDFQSSYISTVLHAPVHVELTTSCAVLFHHPFHPFCYFRLYALSERPLYVSVFIIDFELLRILRSRLRVRRTVRLFYSSTLTLTLTTGSMFDESDTKKINCSMGDPGTCVRRPQALENQMSNLCDYAQCLSKQTRRVHTFYFNCQSMTQIQTNSCLAFLVMTLQDSLLNTSTSCLLQFSESNGCLSSS